MDSTTPPGTSVYIDGYLTDVYTAGFMSIRTTWMRFAFRAGRVFAFAQCTAKKPVAVLRLVEIPFHLHSTTDVSEVAPPHVDRTDPLTQAFGKSQSRQQPLKASLTTVPSLRRNLPTELPPVAQPSANRLLDLATHELVVVPEYITIDRMNFM